MIIFSVPLVIPVCFVPCEIQKPAFLKALTARSCDMSVKSIR